MNAPISKTSQEKSNSCMSCMSMFYKLSINQPLIFTHCQRNHPTSAVKIALQSGFSFYFAGWQQTCESALFASPILSFVCFVLINDTLCPNLSACLAGCHHCAAVINAVCSLNFHILRRWQVSSQQHSSLPPSLCLLSLTVC